LSSRSEPAGERSACHRPGEGSSSELIAAGQDLTAFGRGQSKSDRRRPSQNTRDHNGRRDLDQERQAGEQEDKPTAEIPDRVRTDGPNSSEHERQEILRLAERKRNPRHAPEVQVRSKPGKPLVVEFPSSVELERFLAAVGTSEPAHAGLMLCGILEAACDGETPPTEQDVNRVLAAVTGIGATDEIEGMLAIQMVATHVAVIGTLRRQKGSETLLEQDRYGSLAVKLLRTFAAQIEALQRYRGKGQQKVTVEHVHVNAGGQAIVGAISPGKGGKEKPDE
jgi:hypothetical protein